MSRILKVLFKTITSFGRVNKREKELTLRVEYLLPIFLFLFFCGLRNLTMTVDIIKNENFDKTFFFENTNEFFAKFSNIFWLLFFDV